MSDQTPTKGEEMTAINLEITDRMVLNLDVGDLNSAISLTKSLSEYFSYVKVGSELYAQAGLDAIQAMQDLGKKVFLDLKIHDIPNTVERSLAVHASRGIAMTTVHASGGKEMLLAAKRGLEQGAKEAGVDTPILLGVTVLTSLPPDHRAFSQRLSWIDEVGCDLVCSAHELSTVRDFSKSVKALVPGIRLSGQSSDDQTRVATPYDAIRDGATWIALGRAVYGDKDPLGAAKRVYEEVEKALH